VFIRAGRGIRYRIHSLDYAEEKTTLGAGRHGSDGLSDLTVEVARKPHLTLPRVEAPRFFVRGTLSYSAKTSEDSFHGCYLTVIASRLFDIDGDLIAAFVASPNDSKRLDPIAMQLREEVEGNVRQEAILAATLSAVKLAPAILEPWLEFDIYWSTPHYHITRYASNVSEVLDGKCASETEVLALAETLVLGSLDSPYRKSLQLAGGWYLRGRSEVAGTTERFFGLFQCLEALTNCAEQDADPHFLKWCATIAELLLTAKVEERETLTIILETVKQRMARPVLSERFERLLTLFNLPDQAELKKQFDAMNLLRNKLLHAQVTFVPGHFRGYNVDPTLTALSATMLTAVANRMIEEAKARGYSVSLARPSADGR
jgi:hypothetical protein